MEQMNITHTLFTLTLHTQSHTPLQTYFQKMENWHEDLKHSWNKVTNFNQKCWNKSGSMNEATESAQPPSPLPSQTAVKEYLMWMERWRQGPRGQKEWDISVAFRAHGCYFTPTLSKIFYSKHTDANACSHPREGTRVGEGTWTWESPLRWNEENAGKHF